MSSDVEKKFFDESYTVRKEWGDDGLSSDKVIAY